MTLGLCCIDTVRATLAPSPLVGDLFTMPTKGCAIDDDIELSASIYYRVIYFGAPPED